MPNKKKGSLNDCYTRTGTIKVVIVWDTFRILLPIFYFVISLVIYIKEESTENTDGEKSLLSRSNIIPSSTKAAEDSDDQLATLSFFVGEIFRTTLIVIVAIIAIGK